VKKMKWLFAALLVLQAHFAASYLVPLDREAQGPPRRRLRGPVRGLGLHLDPAAPDPAVRNLGDARNAGGRSWYGLSVGLLVAGICGLLFFWPNDLPSLALFALTIAAGFGDGVIGRTGRI
jgi:hypothetical protein